MNITNKIINNNNNNINKTDFINLKINNSNNNINKNDFINLKINNFIDLINQLNIYSYKRKAKYIIFADYIYSSYCDDFNGFII